MDARAQDVSRALDPPCNVLLYEIGGKQFACFKLSEPEKRRHLLRLWLAAPGARPLPPVFAQRYGKVDIGDRGGIILPSTTSIRAASRT